MFATHNLCLEVLLPAPALLDLLELGERIALPVQAVEAVCALELERRRARGGRVLDEIEGGGVVVRVEVEEEEGLERRRRGGVEREDWG